MADPTRETTPKPPADDDMDMVRLLLTTAQNWVCDGCGHAWWEADAYRCPTCGKSEMHLWGDRDDERQ